MLKTNSKKVREAVRLFVTRNTEGWERDPETFEQACDIVRAAWDGYKYPRLCRQFATLQDAFVDWARGLPLHLFDYFDFPVYGEMVDRVGDVLEQTEAERSKYTNDDAAVLWTKLIFAEVSKLCPLTF